MAHPLASVLLSTILISSFSGADCLWSEWFSLDGPVATTDALLLSERVDIILNDNGGRLQNDEGSLSYAIEQMMVPGLSYMFEPGLLKEPPRMSVSISYGGTDPKSRVLYQLDVNIFVQFYSTSAATIAKDDFEKVAFQGAFRGVVNLAAQASLARPISVVGPPLSTMFVTGSANQNFASAEAYQAALEEEDDYGVSDESLNINGFNNFASESDSAAGPKAKSPKFSKLVPKPSKLVRAARSVNGVYPRSRSHNHMGSVNFGSTLLAITGITAYVAATFLVLVLGYKRWVAPSNDGGDATEPADPFPDTPPKFPRSQQPIGNREVLQWMQTEHSRLGASTVLRSPNRHSPSRRSPRRKSLSSPSRPQSPRSPSRYRNPVSPSHLSTRSSPLHTNWQLFTRLSPEGKQDAN